MAARVSIRTFGPGLGHGAEGGVLVSSATGCYGGAADRLRPIASKGIEMRVRYLLFVGLVAFGVSLSSGAVSAVAAQTPFKGKINAVETGSVVFPTLSLDRRGTGTATHLGRYTEHVVMQIDVRFLTSRGTATFTAANGDTLFASVVGQATPTSSTGVLSIVEVYTITGGTGRFADATGSFTLRSTVNQVTGISSGTFSGAIDH